MTTCASNFVNEKFRKSPFHPKERNKEQELDTACSLFRKPDGCCQSLYRLVQGILKVTRMFDIYLASTDGLLYIVDKHTLVLFDSSILYQEMYLRKDYFFLQTLLDSTYKVNF